MIRILQSLLALIGILVLAFLAATANGATWQEPVESWQIDPGEPAVASRPRLLPVHHCLVPASQPGTHLQGQPFAYGYFGAKPQSTAIYHRSSSGDWFQWTIQRAN